MHLHPKGALNMRILSIAIAVLGVLPFVAPAADISGKWKASFTTPDGQQRENTFDFKVDGDKLTGTVSSALGEVPIQDGKIGGDNISFSVTRNFGGNEVKILYKGKVSGDEIKLKVEAGERSFEMTAKRAAS
jgi:hypothetical protein